MDTDAVGLELVRRLNAAGRGRVTFMPLNRLQARAHTHAGPLCAAAGACVVGGRHSPQPLLTAMLNNALAPFAEACCPSAAPPHTTPPPPKVPDIAYPKQFGSDAVPLYKHLGSDAQYARAVQQARAPRCASRLAGWLLCCRRAQAHLAPGCLHALAAAAAFANTYCCWHRCCYWQCALCVPCAQVFGRFVVCKDRAVMEAVAASGAPVDAITLEGDVMRRKGTLSGGYANPSKSKILTHKRVRRQQGLHASV